MPLTPLQRDATCLAYALMLNTNSTAVDHTVCYRATLCISAIFAVVRCLSVRNVRVLYPEG